MLYKNITENDLDEIQNVTLNIKSSLEIIKEFCFFNENNSKLVTVSALIEMLEDECKKILRKF